ncbi:molecular chaperone HtpG [Candidatus Aerophobetes bacterium]|uniref:Molecular chaperone HtpG n=1 Tax=Aerophobetes bacterium TaxID=2030807 RepID=A0A2A4WXW4_UNCAE|nr:MAG: molecular chaperone HtpG [Candidatus Aerophobetes bacterium]
MAKGTLKINSKNILPIIKKWLYTDKDVFLRELVSNSCDAISKLKSLVGGEDGDHRITLTIDKEKSTLTITDTGLGMSEDEVKKYIAQLAFSGAEDFIKQAEEDSHKESIIGHFGLGFYSAFMPSSKVEIETLSYLEGATPVFWSCDGSPSYTISKGSKTSVGTSVILHINEENKNFLEQANLKAILKKYCSFLPYKIHLGEEVINEHEPLWIKKPSECSDQDYLDFYKVLYPFEQEPMFWVHLNVDYPFKLKGILYFPVIGEKFDSNKPSCHLYCNRVFVADSCKNVIPDYLTALRGVIDSPEIPLNVSRSNLQMDKTVKQLGSHIAKKVADKLVSMHTTSKETYIEKWPNLEIVIKLGVLQDEKFYEKVKTCLLWKTSNDTWTTVEEHLERKSEDDKKIYYYHDDKHLSDFYEMYKNKGIEILFAPSHLDIPLINFLESKKPGLSFQRLDGAADECILDKSREKNVLDSDGKSQSAKIAQAIEALLDNKDVKVEAKSLTSDEVPGFVVMEEKTRRMRDYFSITGQSGLDGMMDKHTLVVNTNSPLVNSIMRLKDTEQTLAKELTAQMYELSLLSQRELSPKAFSSFLKRSNQMLSQLSEIASKA